MRAWAKLLAIVLVAAAAQRGIDANVGRIDDACFTARVAIGMLCGRPRSEMDGAADRLLARAHHRDGDAPTPVELYTARRAGSERRRSAAGQTGGSGPVGGGQSR